MNIERTGVFATEDEATELSQLAKDAQSTPAIAINLHGGGPSAWAWNRVHRRTHALALEHGLPEIQGYYGIDLQNREFVK